MAVSFLTGSENASTALRGLTWSGGPSSGPTSPLTLWETLIKLLDLSHLSFLIFEIVIITTLTSEGHYDD